MAINHGKWKQIITKEFLEKEYYSGKSIVRIAKELNCGETTVIRYAKKFKIKFRDRKYHIIGKKFGKLKVIEQIESNKRKQSQYKCLCKCGNIKIVVGASLVKKLTRSCGCLTKNLLFKGYKDISGIYWSRVQKTAKIKGRKFSLNIKDVWELFLKQDKKCALSGLDITFNPSYFNYYKMKKLGQATEYQTASIDRRDSSKDYTLDNIQLVHKNVNWMKQDFSQEEYIYYCKCVTNNQKVNYASDCKTGATR